MKSDNILRSFDDAYGLVPIPVTVTEDRRFVYVNAACCDAYRREREFFIGKTADCLVEDEAALEAQRGAIQEFNDRLSKKGSSLRHFMNTVDGRLMKFFVVAFSRSIGGREFRVGIALPESHFSLDRLSGVIANQLVRRTIDVDAFKKDLARTPGYRDLIRDIGQGLSLKASDAYNTERHNRRAFARVQKVAAKHINGGKGPPPSADTLKGLAVLIGGRFGDQ